MSLPPQHKIVPGICTRILGIKLRSLFLHGKDFSDWAISLTPDGYLLNEASIRDEWAALIPSTSYPCPYFVCFGNLLQHWAWITALKFLVWHKFSINRCQCLQFFPTLLSLVDSLPTQKIKLCCQIPQGLTEDRFFLWENEFIDFSASGKDKVQVLMLRI